MHLSIKLLYTYNAVTGFVKVTTVNYLIIKIEEAFAKNDATVSSFLASIVVIKLANVVLLDFQ